MKNISITNNLAALRRKYLSAALVLPFAWATTCFAQGISYPITRYGAVGDGKTDNTKAIQKTINKASESGGGTVLVPVGKFVTGVIEHGTATTF